MKLEISLQKKLVHESTFAVRWGDMDALGHVNNALYFRYLESIRIDWFRAINVTPNTLGQGPLVVNAFCNFYQQLAYPDEVLARMYVSDPGRSSFETWVTMARVGEPDVICAAGGATTVWMDFPAQKSAPLPDWLRRLIE